MNITTTYDEAMVKAMIVEAVAREREACAALADEVVEGKRWFNDLPAAIRARSKT